MTNKPFAKPGEIKSKKGWLILAAAFFIFVLVIISLVFWVETSYANRFYPGLRIGYLKIGGQTRNQVLEKLKTIEGNIQTKGLKFSAEGKEVGINPIMVSATDPDLANPILVFNWERTLDSAFGVGHSGNLFNDLISQLKLAIFKEQIPVSYNLNQPELVNILQANFAGLEKPPINAQLKIQGKEIEVISEQSGYVFEYQKAVEQLANNINNLDFSPINFELKFQKPQIKKANTGSAVNSLEKILTIESIKLTAGSEGWEIKNEELVNWLEFQMVAGEVVVGLNQDKVLEFLKPIAEAVNVEVKDGKMKIENDRVTEFQASQDGKTLDLEKSYQEINSQVVAGEAKDIELVINVSPARVKTADTDVTNLGIKEIIGRGTSNFAGSPKNRRHNITVGAASLNGILIKPDEEFSLLKALGPVDGEHGYKQELVIKGDRTIPEYGGGLCQIGTTTFRAALYSGLPITKRQNHSYRVVYYEPAGMDATIYDPAPDMKFINDTGHYILFTARISGDTLIFEFYGTKDGRKIEISPDPPSIFNISSPGEPRYIETEDLKPGEKKKIETAHKGADTYFKYTVTYSGGEVKEQEFKSHYVAWPEVWLVGKEPTATTTDQTAPQDGDLPAVETPPAEPIAQ